MIAVRANRVPAVTAERVVKVCLLKGRYAAAVLDRRVGVVVVILAGVGVR